MQTSTQIPTDMVFSQTSQKSLSTLKVVDLNRLKPEKNQQVDGLTGAVTALDSPYLPGPSAPRSPSPMEEFLKTEPEEFDSAMYRNTDCEFFQDLDLLYSDLAKEEVQTIDSFKLHEEKLSNTDTLYTRLHGDARSPAAASLYNTTPNDPLSPTDGFFPEKFFSPNLGAESKTHFQEQFLDIGSLPVVLEEMVEAAPQAQGWAHTYHTHYTPTLLRQPFIDQEDSMDRKLGAIAPSALESTALQGSSLAEGRKPALSLSLAAAPSWSGELISTPDVVSFVEQLQGTESPVDLNHINDWPAMQEVTPIEASYTVIEDSKTNSPAQVEYSPITPKTESHIESDDDAKSLSSRKRRRRSEDSDETYTPYAEKPSPRKYRRRKVNMPIKDMIQALEQSQPVTKARRGRPPKRRDSTVSSVCSVENSSTLSIQDFKYREVRDKNNEASKRSRMNRKLKELQMEQLAIDLEERNKKLKVKADILEDMTKRLKDALMSAILKQ